MNITGWSPTGVERALCWRSQLLLRVADAHTCRSLVLSDRAFAAAWHGVRARWAAANAAPGALLALAQRSDLATIKAVCACARSGGGGVDIHADHDAVLRFAAARGDAPLAAFVVSACGAPQVRPSDARVEAR
jgi:hypothetical protein